MHNRAAYDLAVGLALRELHEERHAPRERVAAALEVSELAVTRFETGEEKLSAGALILLLNHFNLPWESFLERVKRHLPEAESEILQ
jgi:transcriptional regulator with XRE-family HTH domain